MKNFGNSIQLQVYSTGKKSEIPVRFEDLEKLAQDQLEEGPFYYIAGGAGSERSMNENRLAFDKWKIVPRMLRNVAERDISIKLFGKTYNSPVLFAPIGVQSIAHPEGELETAKAAAELNIPYITSTASTYSLEKVSSVLGNSPKWYQLYCSSDMEIAASMIKRAEANGYEAIVITLDTSIMGWREKDIENAYLPFLQGQGIGNYLEDPVFCSRLNNSPKEDPQSAILLWTRLFGNPALTWEDLAFLRNQTKLPILLKGILHKDDAMLALEYGMDGIIVSNHGGRQVDGTISTLDALESICSELKGELPILMDSGIRRGADLYKALAIGADAVLIGRPYMYGLALGGKNGVIQVMKNILADFDLTMALSGQKSIIELKPSLLVKENLNKHF
ncbi:lactate 2-monooxygenase [Bacillus sp. FJAT-25509]|uniref:lactate 2-monooxygenase n=1 Tax=Bacillus sp. FJAT-25509 TaxID=1712029 RepID=UPI0006FD03E2|nr:lactate 2-monooxygenase [Bacillus sp. FJAT-25509]KQL32910.1 lactate 2-monooxygenase [Bacillus sp. FJAT-25509]